MKLRISFIALAAVLRFASVALAATDHLAAHKIRANDLAQGGIFVADELIDTGCQIKAKTRKLLLPAVEEVDGVGVNGTPSSPIVLDPAPQVLTQKGYLCYKVKCLKPSPATVSMDLVDEFVERSVANGNPVTVFKQVIEICKPVEVPVP